MHIPQHLVNTYWSAGAGFRARKAMKSLSVSILSNFIDFSLTQKIKQTWGGQIFWVRRGYTRDQHGGSALVPWVRGCFCKALCSWRKFEKYSCCFSTLKIQIAGDARLNGLRNFCVRKLVFHLANRITSHEAFTVIGSCPTERAKWTFFVGKYRFARAN